MAVWVHVLHINMGDTFNIHHGDFQKKTFAVRQQNIELPET